MHGDTDCNYIGRPTLPYDKDQLDVLFVLGVLLSGANYLEATTYRGQMLPCSSIAQTAPSVFCA